MAKTEVMTKVGINDLPGMVEKINESLKALKGEDGRKHRAITTHLAGYGKITDIRTVEDMIKAYASVDAKEQAYNAAADSLGIDVKAYPCKINNVTPDEWREEIKVRVVEVRNKLEIERLTKLKEILEANMSIEDKLTKELSEYKEVISALGSK